MIHENSRNKSPPAPPGWKSVTQLSDDGFAGGTRLIKRRLEKLREDLTERFVSNGLSEAEARARVEDNFVGMKSGPAPGTSGPKALYASPEGLAMLDLKPILPKVHRTWRSASQLVLRREVVGTVATVDGKLKKLRDELIQDAVDSGSTEREAVEFVDRELVGYRNTGYGSQEALYASPEALQMLEERGTLKRRTNQRGR